MQQGNNEVTVLIITVTNLEDDDYQSKLYESLKEMPWGIGLEEGSH